jgi:hypothetical protein
VSSVTTTTGARPVLFMLQRVRSICRGLGFLVRTRRDSYGRLDSCRCRRIWHSASWFLSSGAVGMLYRADGVGIAVESDPVVLLCVRSKR